MNRDWQKDMQFESPVSYNPPESSEHPIVTELKKQVAAEKARADAAEAREQKLKELLESITYAPVFDSEEIELERRRAAADKLLASLYPKEEETK